MKNIMVVVADGNETIELFTVVDYLRRVDIKVDIVSIKDSRYLETGQNISYKADKLLADIDYKAYDGIYIPGGTKGALAVRDDTRVIEIIKAFERDKKLIAAICAGPIVLEKAGVLENKKATSHPSMKDQMKNVGEYVDDQILVIDENILTARGAAITNYLALKLVDILGGAEKLKDLKNGIVQEKVEEYFDFKF